MKKTKSIQCSNCRLKDRCPHVPEELEMAHIHFAKQVAEVDLFSHTEYSRPTVRDFREFVCEQNQVSE